MIPTSHPESSAGRAPGSESGLATALDACALGDLLTGAAVLGCGGGGPLWIGRQLLAALSQEAAAGRRPMLVQPADVPGDATLAGIAMTALPNGCPPGDAFPWHIAGAAFDALSSAQPRPLEYVAPVAPGPGNALIPLLVGVTRGLPVVDVTGAPRACPFLPAYLFAGLDTERSRSAALAGVDATHVLRTPNAMVTQQVLMGLIQGPVLAGVAGAALWPMTGAEMRTFGFPSTLSQCIAMGRALREAREAGRDPLQVLRDRLGARVLLRAARATELPAAPGLSMLAFESLDARQRLIVHHLAENLMAWHEGDPGPVAMGPDLVCYLTADGLPFTNDPVDLKAVEGRELVVLAAPAPAAYRIPPMVGVWSGAIAQIAGYAGAPVPTPAPAEGGGHRAPPRTRDELMALLTSAAEVEHLLCCQHLYAAFSLKQGEADGLDWNQSLHTRNWAQLLLLIARQEMEHLALVANLLTSIGGAPHFQRPSFPTRSGYFQTPLCLERFSEATLRRFICIERPEGVPPEDACCPPRMPEGGRVPGVPGGPEFAGEPLESVAQLYARIRWLIENAPEPDSALFIGPSNSQIDGDLLHINFPRPGALGGVWDVTLFNITDRASALRAIDLIVTQGEGGPGSEEYTHYRWYREMLEQLLALRAEDPHFEPALPLVDNTVLWTHADAAPGETLVTHPAARAVTDLLNGAYETLLLLLCRLYAYSDQNQNQVTALAYTMFPLMTQVVRPLCQIVTSLPAFERPTHLRAGPSFEVSSAVHVLPHTGAAFQVLTEKLQSLSTYALSLGERADLPDRLTTIGKNLDIMAHKFAAIAAGEYPPDLLVPGVAHFYTNQATPGSGG